MVALGQKNILTIWSRPERKNTTGQFASYIKALFVIENQSFGN
jgi:hypothetical protein